MIVQEQKLPLLTRLHDVSVCKPGCPVPPWLSIPNGWGQPLAEMAAEAHAEILYLRTIRDELQRHLDHLVTAIFGISSALGLAVLWAALR